MTNHVKKSNDVSENDDTEGTSSLLTLSDLGDCEDRYDVCVTINEEDDAADDDEVQHGSTNVDRSLCNPLHWPIPGKGSFGIYAILCLLGLVFAMLLDFVDGGDDGKRDNSSGKEEDDDDLPVSMIIFIFFPIAQLGMVWIGMSFFELWLKIYLSSDENAFHVEGIGNCYQHQVLIDGDAGPRYVTRNQVSTSYAVEEGERRTEYIKTEKLDDLPSWVQVGGEEQLMFRVLKSDVSYARILYVMSNKERMTRSCTRWCFPGIIMSFGIGCLIAFAIIPQPLLCIWLVPHLLWGTLMAISKFKQTLQYKERIES